MSLASHGVGCWDVPSEHETRAMKNVDITRTGWVPSFSGLSSLTLIFARLSQDEHTKFCSFSRLGIGPEVDVLPCLPTKCQAEWHINVQSQATRERIHTITSMFASQKRASGSMSRSFASSRTVSKEREVSPDQHDTRQPTHSLQPCHLRQRPPSRVNRRRWEKHNYADVSPAHWISVANRRIFVSSEVSHFLTCCGLVILPACTLPSWLP